MPYWLDDQLMRNLALFFQRFSFLRTEDVQQLQQLAVSRTYAAGEIFVPIGTRRQKVGILEKGLSRGYRIKASGEEVSVTFAKEGELVAAHDVIFYQVPTEQQIHFLEDSRVWVFDYRDIERLAADTPRIDRVRQALIQDFLVKVLHRLETFLVYSPEQRYRWLQKAEPELLERVQQKYMASFMGITPVSLSRLRKRPRQP